MSNKIAWLTQKVLSRPAISACCSPLRQNKELHMCYIIKETTRKCLKRMSNYDCTRTPGVSTSACQTPCSASGKNSAQSVSTAADRSLFQFVAGPGSDH